MRTPRVRTHRPRTRSKLLALVAALTVIGTLGIAPVLAVHDEEFQLDGNTTATVTDETVPDEDVQVLDWNSLFMANGTPTSVIDPDAANGFNSGAFERDFLSKASRNADCTEGAGGIFCTSDATTYATGSKDTLPITPGWQCNRDNNVNSKIDIMNAYAAQYIDPVSGDKIMYFGLDKNKDNGNNNVAFWFLQSDASCESPGGAVNFTGSHVDGDVLVVSAFTNGGGVSNISAYRWDGDDDCIDNPDNGAVCDGLPIGSGGDCKTAPVLDNICATTNSGPLEDNDNITTLWPTADATLGVGTTVVTTDFFEGGINLTQAFENIGGAPSCFDTFIANTRSSQELTATLFDFARGSLGGCNTELSTEAGNTANGGSAPSADIGTGTASSGTDTVTLTVDGTANWGGTLSWYLCGPDVTLTTCDPDDGVDVTSRTIDQDSSGADYVSGSEPLTSAGKYCWTAVFEPDAATAAAGVEGAQDDGTNECFTVAPVTPGITTNAVAGPVAVGSALSDSATLTGTASQPGSGGGGTNGVYETIDPSTDGDPAGGTITFSLYGPDDAECANDPVFTDTVDVEGNGTYNSGDFTPTSAGTYLWVAAYSGDSPNTNEISGSCGDENETSVVGPVQPAITTTALSGPVTLGAVIYDDAHLTGTAPQPNGDPAGGTITFNLYGPNDTDCSGAIAFTDTVNVSGDDTYRSGDYTATEAGTYRWVASYSGDDPNTLDVAGECNDENEASVISPVQPAITTEAMSGPVPLGASISDVATLTGTALQPDGDPAEGTITFTAYGPHADTTTCTTVAYTSVVDVSGDGPYVSSAGTGGTFIPTLPGIYNWIAVYSGDDPNTLGVEGSCGDANEFSIVQQLTPVVSTEQTWRPQDEATITVASGGGALNGTVDFELFDNEGCTGTALYDEFDVAIDVAGNGLSATAATNNTDFDVSTSTQVWWKVTYDSNNLGHTDAFSVCVEDTSLVIDNSTPPAP